MQLLLNCLRFFLLKKKVSRARKQDLNYAPILHRRKDIIISAYLRNTFTDSWDLIIIDFEKAE